MKLTERSMLILPKVETITRKRVTFHLTAKYGWSRSYSLCETHKNQVSQEALLQKIGQ